LGTKLAEQLGCDVPLSGLSSPLPARRAYLIPNARARRIKGVAKHTNSLATGRLRDSAARAGARGIARLLRHSAAVFLGFPAHCLHLIADALPPKEIGHLRIKAAPLRHHLYVDIVGTLARCRSFIDELPRPRVALFLRVASGHAASLQEGASRGRHWRCNAVGDEISTALPSPIPARKAPEHCSSSTGTMLDRPSTA
jgi:hypothetical protein